MHLANITFLIFLFLKKCAAKSYRDHLLVHVVPSNEAELEFFKSMDKFYNATFWKRPGLVDRPVDFSLSRLNFADLIRDTKDMDIEFVTIIRDLQSAFDNQTIKPLYIRRRMESFDWRNYYSVEDIFSWLRDLSEKFPKEVKLSKIGESVQNRNILAVTVELAPPTLRRRSVVVVEGGCHAREWISPAFVTYLINNIVNSKKSTNEELKTVAHAHKWVFVPLLNPDGYAYSQMTDRLWRKNLNGVDLNRNFGVAHGRFGAQATKESEDYCGDAPFSEPESSALASFLRDHSDTLEYYISFHSYGQYIVIPYAFEKEHMDNYDFVKLYADKIATRSSKNHGIHYFVGTAFDTVGYLASGVSSDWVKKSLNVPYTITIELPDQGFYGFALPKDRILPTCEATMDSILPFLMAPKKGAKLRHKDPYFIQDSGSERHKSFKVVYFVIPICIFMGVLK